jgi:hypothetical protein
MVAAGLALTRHTHWKTLTTLTNITEIISQMIIPIAMVLLWLFHPPQKIGLGNFWGNDDGRCCC